MKMEKKTDPNKVYAFMCAMLAHDEYIETLDVMRQKKKSKNNETKPKRNSMEKE